MCVVQCDISEPNRSRSGSGPNPTCFMTLKWRPSVHAKSVCRRNPGSFDETYFYWICLGSININRLQVGQWLAGPYHWAGPYNLQSSDGFVWKIIILQCVARWEGPVTKTQITSFDLMTFWWTLSHRNQPNIRNCLSLVLIHHVDHHPFSLGFCNCNRPSFVPSWNSGIARSIQISFHCEGQIGSAILQSWLSMSFIYKRPKVSKAVVTSENERSWSQINQN